MNLFVAVRMICTQPPEPFLPGFARFAERTLDLSIMHECQNNSCGIREIRVAKSKTAGPSEEPGRCELCCSVL